MKKTYIYISGCCIIPILVGLPFMFALKRTDIIEILLLLVAVIELIAWNSRRGKRERANLKAYGRYKIKKTDNGYMEYKEIQNMLVCSAILNAIVSIMWFLVFSQWVVLW